MTSDAHERCKDKILRVSMDSPGGPKPEEEVICEQREIGSLSYMEHYKR